MWVVWVYMQRVELRYWWEYGAEKIGINELNEKRWTKVSRPSNNFAIIALSRNLALKHYSV